MGNPGTSFLNIKWNYEDNQIATACGDGSVKIFDPNNQTLVRSINCLDTEEQIPVTALTWRPYTNMSKTRSVLLCSTATGSILHWHVTSGKLLHKI